MQCQYFINLALDRVIGQIADQPVNEINTGLLDAACYVSGNTGNPFFGKVVANGIELVGQILGCSKRALPHRARYTIRVEPAGHKLAGGIHLSYRCSQLLELLFTPAQDVLIGLIQTPDILPTSVDCLAEHTFHLQFDLTLALEQVHITYRVQFIHRRNDLVLARLDITALLLAGFDVFFHLRAHRHFLDYDLSRFSMGHYTALERENQPPRALWLQGSGYP
ncbi:hypothetical protein [Bordetella trematum]|uniref:hypothetical protein n=1 Tax=Bordetella trematum TaxID=123899 RepID=UPI0015C5314A|nr:hypothetical protein [Bordetella trematum]